MFREKKIVTEIVVTLAARNLVSVSSGEMIKRRAHLCVRVFIMFLAIWIVKINVNASLNYLFWLLNFSLTLLHFLSRLLLMLVSLPIFAETSSVSNILCACAIQYNQCLVQCVADAFHCTEKRKQHEKIKACFVVVDVCREVTMCVYIASRRFLFNISKIRVALLHTLFSSLCSLLFV